MTDGRVARGMVDLVDGAFIAVTVDGSTLGRFASLRPLTENG